MCAQFFCFEQDNPVTNMSKPKNGTSTIGSEVDAKTPSSRISMEENPVDKPPTTPGAMEYDYTNFYFGAGSDAFALLEPFDDWYSPYASHWGRA